MVVLKTAVTRTSSFLRSIPYHPLLLALYPVTALLATNIDQVRVSDSMRAYLFSIAGCLLLMIVLRLLLRDWHKSALLGALALLLFFSYGHAYDALKDVVVLGLKLGRHLVMIPLWIGILIVGIWWITRRAGNLRSWTAALNVMAVVALIYPIYQITSFEFFTKPKLPEEDFALAPADGQPDMDIYYIILDAYGREDTLREFYGFDNAAFEESLEALGFYIAEKSQSNYALSALSLASSLNFDYLSNLEDRGASDRFSERWLKWLVRESKARKAFESLDYQVVSFETGFRFTEIDNADFYYSKKIRDINGFEAMLIQSTAMRILTALENYLPDFLLPDVRAPFEGHRERILYVLDKLEEVPHLEGPKFVFAHIVSPHSPYVFGANGEPVDQEGIFTLRSQDEDVNWEYHVTGYTNQILHINKRIMRVIAQILAQAETPPIIILQADHGGPLTSDEERMAIFNAYYFPDRCKDQLYAEITPVNTFRLILDCYFGGEYELLEDIAYFSTYDAVFDFTVISND